MVKLNVLKDIRIMAAAISLLLSLIAYLRKEPINVDGVLYLQTAANYLQFGWEGAYHSYNWPLYSILIAWLSQLTRFSLLHSAQLLNALLIALLVVNFISILKELGANRSVQLAGTLIILVYPSLNHQRHLVIRDFGYWAFALLAIWLFIRYGKNYRWRYSLSWTLTILLATLFRIEGGILFIFTPLVLLLEQHWSWSKRLAHLAQVYSLPFLSALIASFWFLKTATIPVLGRFQELVAQLQHGLSDTYKILENNAVLLRQAILTGTASHNAKLILIGGLLAVLITKLFSVLTPAYTLLSVHAIRYKSPKFSRQAEAILGISLLMSLITLILFLGQHFFLTERYLLFSCLLLMLWAPFSLVALYQAWCDPNQRANYVSWLFPLLSLLLLGMFLSSIIHFGHSKSYTLEASTWIEKNISRQASLYSNSPEILFYAHRHVTFKQQVYLPLLDDTWHFYDYLALRLHHDRLVMEKHLLTTLRLNPIRIFDDKHGNQILIYKVPHNS